MSNGHLSRGSALGAGLGLLGMLVVVGIILYVVKVSMDSQPTANNAPGLFNAVDYARTTTQDAYNQQKSQLDSVLNAAGNSTPPADQNGAGR